MFVDIAAKKSEPFMKRNRDSYNNYIVTIKLLQNVAIPVYTIHIILHNVIQLQVYSVNCAHVNKNWHISDSISR